MNILILGGGGREHALAWAMRQNPKTDKLIVAPGNPGIGEIAQLAPGLDILDGDAVAETAVRQGVDLAIVGPEAPLVAGVADALRAVGIPTLGPSAAAARLEASKAFTKEVCDAVGAPTAAWARFDTPAAAAAHLRAAGAPVVVKADGLAAGKGVTVAETVAEAEAALATLSGPVVLEEKLSGTEASLFVLADGEDALPFGSAQDHKRIFEGDRGPNTGGMGAFSPAPALTPEVAAAAMDRIVRPVLAEMARRGTPFQGILFAGLMIEAGTPKLIEFNVRFGDPEAQAILMRLGGQALDAIQACVEGRLAKAALHWADDHAVAVTVAAAGYPGPAETGVPVRIPDGLAAPWREVFHAGTAMRDGTLVTAGGRVLSVAARGETLAGARALAYAAAGRVAWPGAQMRRDIGGSPLTDS